MSARGYFITGTDTGIGKTWAGAALMSAFQQQGLRVLGMKPVASGCEASAAGLRNEDALLLQKIGSFTLPYERINPYAFAPAIAPHLAAESLKQRIDLQVIKKGAQALADNCDRLIVEGVGGWAVPLNDSESVADLARALELPVILVVGMRLGCINHALLSAKSIMQSGLPLAGWIANHVDPNMEEQQRNIASIEQRIDAPLLGRFPYQPELAARNLAEALDLTHL